jgi:hypothetical protein
MILRVGSWVARAAGWHGTADVLAAAHRVRQQARVEELAEQISGNAQQGAPQSGDAEQQEESPVDDCQTDVPDSAALDGSGEVVGGVIRESIGRVSAWLSDHF